MDGYGVFSIRQHIHIRVWYIYFACRRFIIVYLSTYNTWNTYM